MASGLLILVGMLLYDLPWTSILLIIPITCVIYILSLVIGYYIAEPLRLLLFKTRAYRAGAPVKFEADGRMHEADELSESMQELIEKLESQQADIARENQRQSEFVSDVAHELRTPLTAIRGNAEMLEDPDLPDEMRARFTAIIISEAERLTRLVNNLLQLQRIENTPADGDELSRINLRSTAQAVGDALHSLLEERGANLAIVGEAPDILGDADRIQEALTNLVENASRFIDPGGHITVDLSGLHGNSVIQIIDDGVGFGDIDPKLLFDRFYRADVSRARTTGGTGLGLAIVKSIIDQHDGTIEAVNMPEGGANFIVAIPSID